ncbi:MAG: hypothetical protein AAF682_32015 [Planctomycetota bacterium]
MLGATCVADPALAQETKIEATGEEKDDEFGWSIDYYGNTAVVGAPGDDFGAGAAYVFVRGASGWTEQQRLVAVNRQPGDAFGQSVSIWGNRIVIGAPNKDGSGSAFVYLQTAGVWSAAPALKAPNAAPGDDFGSSVDIWGNFAVVGAPGRDDDVGTIDVGAAYVYSNLVYVAGGYTTTDWYHMGTASVFWADAFDRLGSSVAISGVTIPPEFPLIDPETYAGTIVVGMPGEDSASTEIDGAASDNSALNAGAVYSFPFSYSTFGPILGGDTYLKAPNAGQLDIFGTSVDVRCYLSNPISGQPGVGSCVLIGAPWEGGSGAAYRFDYVPSSPFTEAGWTTPVLVKAESPVPGGMFGTSVALGTSSPERFVVGAPQIGASGPTDSPTEGAGRAHFFVQGAGGGYAEYPLLYAADGELDDNFGRSVAVEGLTVLAGADGEEFGSGDTDSGAAYAFEYTPPVLDAELVDDSTCVGATYELMASAEGYPAPTLAWFGDGGVLLGTGPTLSLVGVDLAHAGTYTVVAENAYGSDTSAMVLSVGQAPAIDPGGLLEARTEACEGSGVVLSVSLDDVTGTPPPNYQWFRDGVLLGGETDPFLSLSDLEEADGGVYALLVSNSCGATSTSSTLTVSPLPVIVVDPQDTLACSGSDAVLTTVASAGGATTLYQWYENGVPLFDIPGQVGGSGTATLTLYAVDSSDSGNVYWVEATACGTVMSDQATLSITLPPTITAHPQSVSVCEGVPAVFSVQPDDPSLDYQWFKDGIALAGETAASLTLPPAVPADDGAVIFVEVTGTACPPVASDAATLSVVDQLPVANWIGPDGGLFVDADNWDSCLPPSEEARLHNASAFDNRAVIGDGEVVVLETARISASGAGSQVVQVDSGGQFQPALLVELQNGGRLDVAGPSLLGAPAASVFTSAIVNNSGLIGPAKALPTFNPDTECPPGGVCLGGGLLGGTDGLVSVTNQSAGLLFGHGAVLGSVLNFGEFGVYGGDMEVDGPLTNDGTLRIFDGTKLTVGVWDVASTGALELYGSAQCIGCPPGPVVPAVLDVNSSFGLTSGARVNFDGRIEVSGDWDVAIDDAADFDLSHGTLQLDGTSLFGSPQKVEVLGGDFGAQSNYGAPVVNAFGEFVVGPNPATVELVDLHDNDSDGLEDVFYAQRLTVSASAQLIVAGCTLYVDELVLEPGATADLSGGTLFYGSVSPADPCDPASGVFLVDCGALQPMPPPDCNGNGIPDNLDIAAGTSLDCNQNQVPDECDFALGFSLDLDGDGQPDECQSFHADRADISLSELEGQTMFLHPGAAYAGQLYFVGGSMSGTQPGTPYAGLLVPLNLDSYSITTLALANTLPFEETLGVLDAEGEATAGFQLIDGLLDSSAVGTKLYHAFLLDPFSPAPALASNPISLEILP